jgi:hypothetical protein
MNWHERKGGQKWIEGRGKINEKIIQNKKNGLKKPIESSFSIFV